MRRPVMIYDDERLHLPSLTVYEASDEPTSTGLLDATGAKLTRQTPPQRIGFDLSGSKPRVRVKAGWARR